MNIDSITSPSGIVVNTQSNQQTLNPGMSTSSSSTVATSSSLQQNTKGNITFQDKKDYAYLDDSYPDFDEEVEITAMENLELMGMEAEPTIFDEITDSFFISEDRRRSVGELTVRISKTRLWLTREEARIYRQNTARFFERRTVSKTCLAPWSQDSIKQNARPSNGPNPSSYIFRTRRRTDSLLQNRQMPQILH